MQEGALTDVCGRMMLRHARDTLSFMALKCRLRWSNIRRISSGVRFGPLCAQPWSIAWRLSRPINASPWATGKRLGCCLISHGNNGRVSAAFVLIVRIPALAPRFRSLRSDSSDMRSKKNCSCQILNCGKRLLILCTLFATKILPIVRVDSEHRCGPRFATTRARGIAERCPYTSSAKSRRPLCGHWSGELDKISGIR